MLRLGEVFLSPAVRRCDRLPGDTDLSERDGMKSGKDVNAERKRLVELWHRYGEAFTVFVPEQQPAPEIWDPALPGRDDNGRLDPQALKHWRYLFPTKEFLRQRYAKHHVLEGPSLHFDCLVPKFQAPMRQVWGEDQYGNLAAFEVQDSPEWYAGAIRIGIFGGEVGFSCRSQSCERHWCILHKANPKRINPVDIYSLIQLFEGCSTTTVLSAVAKGFGEKLGHFETKGTGSSSKIIRYAVPKRAVYDLIARYRNVRHQHVAALLKEAEDLIKGCSTVEWHGRLFDDDVAYLSRKVVGNIRRINGAAVKAYLWLLIRQEEAARNTKAEFRVSDAELAHALGVSRPTAKTYREELARLGLVDYEKIGTGKRHVVAIKRVKY